VWLAIGVAIGAVSCARSHADSITQVELIRRTQECLDAIPLGDRAPWDKYLASDAILFDEKGRSMDKQAFLADQSPMPPGYSGAIRIVRPQSRILDHTAILSYDLDETETIFGQNLQARYHVTDTWVWRDGEWRIVAEQALRYYEDPAPGTPDVGKYAEYNGIYELAPGKTLAVSSDGPVLYAQRSGKEKEVLVAEAADIFFRKGVEGRQLFRRDARGKVDALIDRRNNEDVLWRKVP